MQEPLPHGFQRRPGERYRLLLEAEREYVTRAGFGVMGGMLRRPYLLVGLLLGLISVSLSCLADKRVALVIGNSAYIKTAALPNPKNDALAIASLLRKAQFDV